MTALILTLSQLSAPALALDPTPAASPAADAYTYNPIGKRDPFGSFIVDPDLPPITGGTPLQEFDLDQYQLVGIVWGVEPARALFIGPDGRSHVAEVGTYIGRSWGQIQHIHETGLEVVEEYMTHDGTLVQSRIELALPIDSPIY